MSRINENRNDRGTKIDHHNFLIEITLLNPILAHRPADDERPDADVEEQKVYDDNSLHLEQSAGCITDLTDAIKSWSIKQVQDLAIAPIGEDGRSYQAMIDFGQFPKGRINKHLPEEPLICMIRQSRYQIDIKKTYSNRRNYFKKFRTDYKTCVQWEWKSDDILAQTGTWVKDITNADAMTVNKKIMKAHSNGDFHGIMDLIANQDNPSLIGQWHNIKNNLNDMQKMIEEEPEFEGYTLPPWFLQRVEVTRQQIKDLKEEMKIIDIELLKALNEKGEPITSEEKYGDRKKHLKELEDELVSYETIIWYFNNIICGPPGRRIGLVLWSERGTGKTALVKLLVGMNPVFKAKVAKLREELVQMESKMGRDRELHWSYQLYCEKKKELEDLEDPEEYMENDERFFNEKIIYCRNEIRDYNFTCKKDPKLLFLDDLALDKNPHYYESLKAFFTGEYTTLTGKYCKEAYQGGLPCILSTNSNDTASRFMTDPEFKGDCVVVRLRRFMGTDKAFEKLKTKRDQQHAVNLEEKSLLYLLAHDRDKRRKARFLPSIPRTPVIQALMSPASTNASDTSRKETPKRGFKKANSFKSPELQKKPLIQGDHIEKLHYTIYKVFSTIDTVAQKPEIQDLMKTLSIELRENQELIAEVCRHMDEQVEPRDSANVIQKKK
jgi:hypothetical protein